MHERLLGLMVAPLYPALAFLAGVALGVLFYGGLWWTVRRIPAFRRPGASVLASLLLRTGIALGGIYIVAGADGVRLLLCLTGFLAARVAVTWFTRGRSPADGGIVAALGARHAP